MATTMKAGVHDSLKEVITKLVGSRVELTLRSGGTYSGKLTMVGDSVLTVSELSDKEFYDAVINILDIIAVEAKVRDR